MPNVIVYQFKGLGPINDRKQLQSLRTFIARKERAGFNCTMQIVWYGVPIYNDQPQAFMFSVSDPTGHTAPPEAFKGWRNGKTGFVDRLLAQRDLLRTKGATDLKVYYVIIRWS